MHCSLKYQWHQQYPSSPLLSCFGCYICFSFFNPGPQDDYREAFHGAVCGLNVLLCLLHKCPASWTRWPLLEPCASLWPQNHWWLLRVWFSVSAAHSPMGSWPLTQLPAATVETKACEDLLPPCFSVLTWNVPGRVDGGVSYITPSCGSEFLPFNEGNSSV